MIDRSVASAILSKCLRGGADFAELFFEERREGVIGMLSGEIEAATSALELGVGLRVMRGLKSVYTYGNDLGEQGLDALAVNALAALKVAPMEAEDVVLNPAKRIRPVIEISPADVELARKAEIVRQADAGARERESITQVNVTLADATQRVRILNSEGLDVSDQRTRVRLSVVATAGGSGENQTGHEGPGAASGYEFFEKVVDPRNVGRQAAKTADTMLKAESCPKGIFPVVIYGGFGGVIFHEACGHALESSFVSKGISVFSNKLGEAIASPKVTAVDDGVIPWGWGSLGVDDEGCRTQRNLLIEEGVLKSYMVDRMGARRMDHPRTGNGRRQSYRYAPTSRMTNTFIEAGSDDEEAMIRTLGEGLVAKKMGGGSVNPATGEFNFAVNEGWWVKDGRIVMPVRGATLIGKGQEILFCIDSVGKKVSLGQGMCGSFSGSIPVNVGQPAIRVSRIAVGGR